MGIRLSEIRSALTKLLYDGFKDQGFHIVAEDIDQARNQNEKIFPCLHLQLTPFSSDLVMGADARDKTVLADITFMEETKSTNEAMYAVADQAEEKLRSGFWVGDEYLTIESLGNTIADDMLHITFQVQYRVPVVREEQVAEQFKELSMDMKRG